MLISWDDLVTLFCFIIDIRMLFSHTQNDESV